MNIRGKFYFKFMWNVMTTLWHSCDLTIKLNLESETVTSWLELTKEKTKIDSEETARKIQGLEFRLPFWFWDEGRYVFLAVFPVKKEDQSADTQPLWVAGFQPRLCLLSLIDKWMNVISGTLNISTCANILYGSYWKWYISSFFNL